MPNTLLRRPGLLAYGALALSAVFTTPGRGWFLAVTILLVCVGLGKFVLRRGPWRDAGAADSEGSNLWGGLVGVWLLLCALILLIACGALQTVTAGIVLGIGGLAAALEFGKHPGPGFDWQRVRWPHLVLAVLAFAILEPWIVRCLLPDSDWDGALYHLPMAQNFVDLGMFAPGLKPAALYRPGITQSLYALGFALHVESATIPLNCLAVFGAACLCFRIGATFWNGATGWWAVAVYLSSCRVLEYGMDVRVEPFVVVFFLYALYGAMLFLRDGRAYPFLGAALAGGLLAGTKYNGLLFAILALGGLGIAMWFVRSCTTATKLRLAAIGLLLCMVPSGVFYARNYALFGNPVHPYRSATKSVKRQFDEFIGERWSKIPKDALPPMDVMDLQFQHFERKRKAAGKKEPWHRSLVLLQSIVHPEINKPFHWVSPWILGFLLIPLFRRDRWSLGILGLAVGGYAFAILVLARSGEFPVRYLAPLFPVFSLGTALCLGRIPWTPAILALAPLVLAPVAYCSWQQQNYFRYLLPDRYLFGNETEALYLARVGLNGTLIHPKTGQVRFVNQGMPRARLHFGQLLAEGKVQPTDRIYAIAEAKTFKVPLPCKPSNDRLGMSFLNKLRKADWDNAKLARQLWDEGFRYLLINKGWMEYNNQYSDAPTEVLVLSAVMIQQFLDRHVGPVEHLDSGTFIAPIKQPE